MEANRKIPVLNEMFFYKKNRRLVPLEQTYVSLKTRKYAHRREWCILGGRVRPNHHKSEHFPEEKRSSSRILSPYEANVDHHYNRYPAENDIGLVVLSRLLQNNFCKDYSKTCGFT